MLLQIVYNFIPKLFENLNIVYKTGQSKDNFLCAINKVSEFAPKIHLAEIFLKQT